MNKLIEQYVNRLNESDILVFAKKNGIELSSDELKIVYTNIKQNWKTIIYGNPRPILDDVKSKVSSLTYEKIENLYSRFYDKYKNYL